MCPSLLGDARLYAMLLRCDEDLASGARAAGCECGGVLHSARYGRTPRGATVALPEGYDRRDSFCCAEEGCRRRTTPASLRFLGRKVYLGAVVTLVTAMKHGVSGRRAAELRRAVGVSRETLARWRAWWAEVFSIDAVLADGAGTGVTAGVVGADAGVASRVVSRERTRWSAWCASWTSSSRSRPARRETGSANRWSGEARRRCRVPLGGRALVQLGSGGCPASTPPAPSGRASGSRRVVNPCAPRASRGRARASPHRFERSVTTGGHTWVITTPQTELARALKRRGSVVVTDANAELHLPVFEKSSAIRRVFIVSRRPTARRSPERCFGVERRLARDGSPGGASTSTPWRRRCEPHSSGRARTHSAAASASSPCVCCGCTSTRLRLRTASRQRS